MGAGLSRDRPCAGRAAGGAESCRRSLRRVRGQAAVLVLPTTRRITRAWQSSAISNSTTTNTIPISSAAHRPVHSRWTRSTRRMAPAFTISSCTVRICATAKKIARYLIEHYEVKNLILNVYLDNGLTYDEESDRLTKNLHYKEDPDTSVLSYYTRYLFADPRYALSKLNALRTDTILPQTFDVFDERTGCYDKRVRDAEPIGSEERYLESYPVFADYPHQTLSLPYTEQCMQSVAAIKTLCEEAGVNLTVAAGPVYAEYLKNYEPETVAQFYRSLAQVTPFWDFFVQQRQLRDALFLRRHALPQQRRRDDLRPHDRPHRSLDPGRFRNVCNCRHAGGLFPERPVPGGAFGRRDQRAGADPHVPPSVRGRNEQRNGVPGSSLRRRSGRFPRPGIPASRSTNCRRMSCGASRFLRSRSSSPLTTGTGAIIRLLTRSYRNTA